mgnify:CR=1 FL=1
MTPSATYKQVPTSADDAHPDPDLNSHTQHLNNDNDTDQTKKIKNKTMDQITAKVHALFWVALAIALVVYLDVRNVVLNDNRVNRLALNLAVFSFAANVTICLYLTFWLPFVKKITLPWEIYCPRMIPTATALGLTCMMTSIVAMWSVWGFLSPLIIFFLTVGLIMCSHFIPWPF